MKRKIKRFICKILIARRYRRIAQGRYTRTYRRKVTTNHLFREIHCMKKTQIIERICRLTAQQTRSPMVYEKKYIDELYEKSKRELVRMLVKIAQYINMKGGKCA